MLHIILATKNRGKILEVSHLLKDLNIKLLSLLDFENAPHIVEDGKSFMENAKKKAIEVYTQFGVPSIGEDSGLSVEQLNGAPGIFSARFAGENATDDENNRKLLEELSNFPEPHLAAFTCNACYYDGNEFLTSSGEIKGKIIHQKRGTNGFGYDPYFIPDGFNKTTAELSMNDKNKISHRYKAFNSLKNLLRNKLELK
jgi:XTP/dITP diphosphohydrolase